MDTLFTYSNNDETPTASQEQQLGDAMREQWKEDLDVVRQRGIIPDWIGEPSQLSKDKARLLDLLYEVGFVTWDSNPSKNNRTVTKAIGLNNTGNAKAVIDMCCKDGLVSSRLYRGNQIFEMTMEGEFALEEWQIDVEMGLI